MIERLLARRRRTRESVVYCLTKPFQRYWRSCDAAQILFSARRIKAAKKREEIGGCFDKVPRRAEIERCGGAGAVTSAKAEISLVRLGPVGVQPQSRMRRIMTRKHAGRFDGPIARILQRTSGDALDVVPRNPARPQQDALIAIDFHDC